MAVNHRAHNPRPRHGEMGARDSVLVSLLIKLLLGVANGLVWAVMLACLFKPQLWMALGPIIGSVLALKGAAP
jgi:hypothetical protein